MKKDNDTWELGTGTVVAVSIMAAIGLTALAIWNRRSKYTGARAGNAASTSGFCKHRGYPLRYGSCGSEVVQIQKILKALRFDLGPGGVDGKFGERTEAGVQRYLGKKTISLEDITRFKNHL